MMLRLPCDSEREATKAHGLALHLLTTYTSGAAPVNTNRSCTLCHLLSSLDAMKMIVPILTSDL
jgi:hypothetical protein